MPMLSDTFVNDTALLSLGDTVKHLTEKLQESVKVRTKNC